MLTHWARRNDEAGGLNGNSYDTRRRRRRLGEDRLPVGQRVALMVRVRGSVDGDPEAHANNERYDNQCQDPADRAARGDHDLKLSG